MRARRREDAHPEDALVAGHARLGDRRQLRQQRRARQVGDRQRLELARSHVRCRRCIGVELDVHAAGEQIGHDRRRPLVGNVDDVDLQPTQQELDGDVGQGAIAGVAMIELAGMRACVGDKFRESVERHRRWADQQLGDCRDQRHRHDVLLGVVGQVGVERRIDRVVGRGQQQRVAVGRRLGERVGGDRAAGARPVVDHHALAEGVVDAVGEQPRHDVDRAARGKRHEQPDRPLRVAGARGRDG